MVSTLFADDGTATVTAGGTTAPAQGTVESWTVSGSTLPGAATGVSQAFIADPSAPSEVICVTNTSGSTLTVTRGADGTTPVAHSTPFTVNNVVTAGILAPLGTAGAANGVALLNGSGVLPAGQGGTGQATQQAAMDALAGATTSGDYLRGSGSHVVMSAIQAADVPVLNQNTTGTAANITDTLDQVPAPAAAVSLNSHKITNLANGTAAQDAAAFGQIPAALPPSGAAGGDLGSTYPNPTVTGTHLASPLPVAQGGTASGSRVWAGLLTPTGVKTSGYTAAAGDYVPCDTTSGAFTVTLPAAPADLTVIGVKMIVQGVLSSTVTIACGGSDVFNKAAGGTALTLTLLNQGVLLQYSASGGIWYVHADDLALSQLDARYGLEGPTRGYRPPDISFIDTPYMGNSSGGPAMSTSGAGSTGSTTDTSDFVLGSQACYVTSNGAGANTKITAAFGGSPLNMAGKSLVVWVKAVNLGHFSSGYPRVFLGDTGLANVYMWKISSAVNQPWNLDGEWMRITLPFGAATVTGSPSRASLGNLIIQFFDDNTGNPVTVHLGGIATMAEPATAFPNGVVSLTFDDGYSNQFTVAKPLMDTLGYRGTAYLITEALWNKASGLYGGYLTTAQAQALEWYSGWEIGAHAFTAANHDAGYVAIGDAAAQADMAAAKGWLISQGFKAPDQFAYPLGLYDAQTIINVASLFGSGRTISTSGSFPDETFPPAQLSRLRAYPVSESSGIVSAASYITAAAANKEWLIFTFHQILASGATGNLELSSAHFSTLLSDIQAAGIEVLPVSEVLKQTETQYTIGITAADTSVVVGGTLAKPTLATNTLDVIAADHPPAAAVGMNSQKITGLANGSGAQDAAAFGQIPVADTTATDIAALGAQAAGGIGKWADAGHVHPTTGVALLSGASFTGNVSISESATAGGILTVTNSHTTPSSPSVQYTAQTAADLVVGVEVSGDTNERLTIDSNGRLQWGNGSGAVDTSLSRTGAGALQTNSFRISNSAAAGNVLNVLNTNSGVPTAPNVELVAHNAADPELGIGVTGDTVYRLVIDSNGKHSWGPGGSTAADTVVQRSGAGVLQVTTGSLDLNSSKITSLANGTASTDAAAFGQIPVLDSTAADIAAPGTQAAGAVGKAADAGHVHPVNIYLPSDNGLLAANADIDAASSGTIVVAGSVYLLKVPIRYAITATNIWFFVSTGQAGTSSGSFVGLYSSSGTLLSGSSDIGSLLTGAGAKSQALTTPQSLAAGTFVWVALLVNMSATQPSFQSFSAGTASRVNLNLTAANYRFAINGTSQTALPSPSITPSSNTSPGNVPYWVGIN